jgi:putative methionine-R-sulfoxide reductase with GAF domain
MPITTDRLQAERAILDLIELDAPNHLQALLASVTDALGANFPHYTGVYLYLLEGETLVLGPFRGRPTEHVRIPVGAGICGRAARVKQTVQIDDVSSDADYIACSLETRSEIVVPIIRDGRVLGEIDVDSDVPRAFSETDKSFLERVAELLSKRFA